MTTVGAYEAKTHLLRLLERVARGERITITKHGVPVAVLVPPPPGKEPDVRAVVREMLAFREGRTLGEGITIRYLIEEGRRY